MPGGNQFVTANKPFSYRSSNTKVEGESRATCRLNSEPMDPPAPVTNTRARVPTR